MSPEVPSPRSADEAPPCTTNAARPRFYARGKWRLLLSLLVLGLANGGGCALSPGYDLPSMTTGDGEGLTDTDDDSTGSPIAGTGGSSAASGGTPSTTFGETDGDGGMGGDICLGPGGEGGSVPVTTSAECGGDPK